MGAAHGEYSFLGPSSSIRVMGLGFRVLGLGFRF